MNSSSLKRMLEKDGWILERVKGSHHQFKHPTKTGVVTLPHPSERYSERNGTFNPETGRAKIVLSLKNRCF